MNKDIRADRIRPLVDWVNQCFPGVSTRQVVPWAGLRPMMPSMLPRVGAGRRANVFYNTGHGHLGWTLSAVTADKVAGINIRVGLQSIVLSYRMKSTDEVVEQRVQTQTSPCHLGGQRQWFTCPRCSKRVAVLYAPSQYFVCRLCGGLGYATQKEGVGDRAMTKADRLRKRLGWPAGIAHGDGGKPKGMHWKTYHRLKRDHDELKQVSLYDISRKLGFLHKLLKR